MRSYRIEVDSENHISHVNGAAQTDREGNDLSTFEVSVRDGKPGLLDVVSAGWEVVATFVVMPDCIIQITNEVANRGASFSFSEQGESHEFPTFPRVKATLIEL